MLPPSSPPLEETWKHGSKVVVPFQQTGDGIEVRLRHAAQDKMLRVTEYFKDFDPLRSGFISSEGTKASTMYTHIARKLCASS